MRIIMIIAALLLIAGCPAKQSGSQPASQAGQGASTPSAPFDDGDLLMIFSATEGDQWSRDLLSTVGDQLNFNPWSSPQESGHLDLYGPYTGHSDGREIQVHIVFTGLSNVVGLEGQWSIAEQAIDWINGLDAQLAWIDGDPAQLQIGQVLIKEMPIVFTGIVLDCGLYYALGDNYSGFYKRHSMSTVFGEIWNQDANAQQIGLITDESHTSAVRIKRFVDIQNLLPEGSLFEIPDAISSWEQLRSVLGGFDESIDAVIVTGMGLEGSSSELRLEDCPANLLEEITVPVVTLGPTRMDDIGVTAVSIDPAVHARMALNQALDICSGTDPRVFVPLVPEEMSLFKSEGTQAVTIQQDAPVPAADSSAVPAPDDSEEPSES